MMVLPIVYDEDDGDAREEKGRAALPPAAGRERDGDGGRGEQRQHAGRVRPRLRVDARAEDDGDDDADRRHEQRERARGARPVGGHAVARQVARHDVE